MYYALHITDNFTKFRKDLVTYKEMDIFANTFGGNGLVNEFRK